MLPAQRAGPCLPSGAVLRDQTRLEGFCCPAHPLQPILNLEAHPPPARYLTEVAGGFAFQRPTTLCSSIERHQ